MLPIWLGMSLMVVGMLLLTVVGLTNLLGRFSDFVFKAGLGLFLIGIVAAVLST